MEKINLNSHLIVTHSKITNKPNTENGLQIFSLRMLSLTETVEKLCSKIEDSLKHQPLTRSTKDMIDDARYLKTIAGANTLFINAIIDGVTTYDRLFDKSADI